MSAVKILDFCPAEVAARRIVAAVPKIGAETQVTLHFVIHFDDELRQRLP